MKTHEFFAKYANTPLDDRSKMLPDSYMTLNDVYERVKKNEEIVRDRHEESKELIAVAAEVLQ